MLYDVPSLFALVNRVLTDLTKAVQSFPTTLESDQLKRVFPPRRSKHSRQKSLCNRKAMFAVMGGFAITTPCIDRHGKECTMRRLVASEASLRLLPKDTYETVSWISVFPHFSW